MILGGPVRPYVKASDIEPGTILQGKVISSWHVTDTSYHWYEFGQRCDYIGVEMTDGTTIYYTLITEGV